MKKILLTLFLSSLSLYSLNIGESPKEVILENKNGGYLDGTAWNSTMIKDKVYVLFYVDPDEKDTNNALTEALKAKSYDLDSYGTIAIVNLAATWLPNFAIESALKKKQKSYPNTTYVKDKRKFLVQEWELQDDSSNVLLFNKKGELLYKYAGKLGDREITKVLSLIDGNI